MSRHSHSHHSTSYTYTWFRGQWHFSASSILWVLNLLYWFISISLSQFVMTIRVAANAWKYVLKKVFFAANQLTRLWQLTIILVLRWEVKQGMLASKSWRCNGGCNSYFHDRYEGGVVNTMSIGPNNAYSCKDEESNLDTWLMCVTDGILGLWKCEE